MQATVQHYVNTLGKIDVNAQIVAILAFNIDYFERPGLSVSD